MRTILVFLTALVMTIVLGSVVLVASLFRVPERPNSIYERCMRWWASSLNRAAGVTVRLHGEDHLIDHAGAVYVSNHVSWFDIFALAAVLPRYTFIAKAELRKIPLFGRAAEAAGIVFIERENRKAAFESYRSAVGEIERGRAVIVCPEGTRGYEYALRPFKKGPFVLAIAAQAPIVPVVVHGAREVMPKGSFRIRPGVVDIHLLDDISTQGMTYDDRHRLMTDTWRRMASALRELYGVTSSTPAIGQPAIDAEAG